MTENECRRAWEAHKARMEGVGYSPLPAWHEMSDAMRDLWRAALAPPPASDGGEA